MEGQRVQRKILRPAAPLALLALAATGWTCAFPPYEVVEAPDAGSGGGTGGGPPSCWDLPVDAFVEDKGFEVGLLAGEEPHSPFVTPDGLSLYYIATDINANKVLFKATRADRSAQFSGGVPEPVTSWPAMPSVEYPALAFDGAELLVTRDSGLYVSLWNNDSWGPFAAVVLNEPPEMLKESLHSLTKDGERLIFQRNDGPIADPNGPVILERFHEAVRTSRVPGGAFGPSAPVEIPTITSDSPFPRGQYCTALSADGTWLFFASNRVEVTPETLPSALKLAVARRASRTAPWSAAEWLPDALNSDIMHTCASSITEDGCEIYYHQFGDGMDYTIHVARRSPP